MAEKRMLSKQVISSDAFLDMPDKTQLFYVYLSIWGDDDGFIDCPRLIMRSVGATDTDVSLLVKNNFLIYFRDEGICVVRHWNVMNTIRKDLYKETKYRELKKRLILDKDGIYQLCSGDEPAPEQETDTSPLPGFSLADELTPGKPEILNLTSRVDYHRRHWESCGLPPASIITNVNALDEMKDPINSFSVEKIDKAIANFAKVVLVPEFDPQMLPGGHVPNFKNFMIRWIVFPASNFFP